MRQPLVKVAAVIAFVLVFLPIESRASTNITGPIATNTTWTAAGNPYVFTGSVSVPAGVTLTIEAGVNIIVAESDDQGTDPDDKIRLTVEGTLLVNGTAANRVTFSGVLPGMAASWDTIFIAPGTGSASFQYASIGGAAIGIATQRLGVATTINHVHIFDASFAGVLVVDGNPQILASLFTAGALSEAVGIRATDSGFPTIVNNVISGFDVGIHMNQAVSTTSFISNNTIVGTNVGIHVEPTSGTGTNVFITNNNVNNLGAGTTGILVAAAPGVNVTLSHNNVNAPTPYNGVSAGPGSLSVSPHFVSATDFHLLASSPLIDAGTGPTNAPLVDFDNVTRPAGAGWDIGAYEFVSTVAPPTANAGPDQNFTADAGGTASVTLTGVGTAPPGSTLNYRWSEGATELAAAGPSPTLTHTFASGVHLLKFEAIDQFGQSGSDTVLIGVLAAGGGGAPGPAGPQGNSVTMAADTTVCTTGGVQLTIVDSTGAAVGTPLYVCNGATGATGAAGATGAQGPPGPPGPPGAPGSSGSAAPGSVLFVVKGTPAPTGYRFAGSTKQVVPGRGQIEMDIYIKQ